MEISSSWINSVHILTISAGIYYCSDFTTEAQHQYLTQLVWKNKSLLDQICYCAALSSLCSSPDAWCSLLFQPYIFSLCCRPSLRFCLPQSYRRGVVWGHRCQGVLQRSWCQVSVMLRCVDISEFYRINVTWNPFSLLWHRRHIQADTQYRTVKIIHIVMKVCSPSYTHVFDTHTHVKYTPSWLCSG